MDIAPILPFVGAAVDSLTKRGAGAVAVAAILTALSGLGDSLLFLLNSVFLLTALYSLWYVRDVERPGWYWAWLDVFYGSMYLFLTTNNWLALVAAWGGLDAASWALILTYPEDWDVGRVGYGGAGKYAKWIWTPADSAMRAIVTVELGTAALAVGMALGASLYGPDITRWGPLPPTASALILLAAFVKAAQLPFTDWLMTAMSAPTPVSALLHSATMVAAGPILLIRLAPALASYWPYAFIVGLATAIYGGVVAIWQREPKVLLASSTASYLGLATAFSLASPAAAAALIMMHGFAKASLFMAVGESIHHEGTRFPKSYTLLGKAAMALALASLLGFLPLGAYAKSQLPEWETAFSLLTAGYIGILLLRSRTEGLGGPMSALALISAALELLHAPIAPSPIWLLALLGLLLYMRPHVGPLERRLYLPALFSAVGRGLLALALAVARLDSLIDRGLLASPRGWYRLARAVAALDGAADSLLHMRFVDAVRRISTYFSSVDVEVYLYGLGAAALAVFVVLVVI